MACCRPLIDEERYEEAIALLNILLVCERDEPKLYAHRGFSLYRLGAYAAAIPDLQNATDMKPDAKNTLFILGRSLQETLRFEEALAVYRRVTQLDPQTADAHSHAGYCLERLGLAAEASRAYAAALRADPQDPLALRQMRGRSEI